MSLRGIRYGLVQEKIEARRRVEPHVKPQVPTIRIPRGCCLVHGFIPDIFIESADYHCWDQRQNAGCQLRVSRNLKAFWAQFIQNAFIKAYIGFVLYSWWQLQAEQEDMYEVDLLIAEKNHSRFFEDAEVPDKALHFFAYAAILMVQCYFW